MVTAWCGDLLGRCSNVLSPVVQEQMQIADDATETLTRALFTVGEVASVSPSAVPTHLCTLVQAFISPAMAGTQQPTTSMPVVLRGHALIALGKMCLQDEALAKRYGPVR